MPTFKDIFDWENWDEITENIDVFYNCYMLMDVGSDISEGDIFDQIYFNKNKLTLEFFKTPEDTVSIKKEFVLKN